MFDLSLPVLIVTVIVGVLSAGRLTRLITADSWPPILWAKSHWDSWTDKTERRKAWWLIFNCHWCLSPWITLIIGAWAVIDIDLDGFLDWPWWAFNGWMAASYVVGMVVHRDEGPGDEGPEE